MEVRAAEASDIVAGDKKIYKIFPLIPHGGNKESQQEMLHIPFKC